MLTLTVAYSSADDTESLAVARSIGDSPFKQNLDLPIELQAIIPIPEVTSNQLRPGTFVFYSLLHHLFFSDGTISCVPSLFQFHRVLATELAR